MKRGKIGGRRVCPRCDTVFFERVHKIMGSKDHVVVKCPECGWKPGEKGDPNEEAE